jgi:hypothetical protein
MASSSVPLIGTALLTMTAAAVALRRRLGLWTGDVDTLDPAAVRVSIGPLRDGTQEIELLLHATTRAHPLVRFDADREEAARCGLLPPPGFAIAAVEAAESRVAWVPARPLALTPGTPARFAFRIANPDAPPTIVGVRLAKPLKRGGGLLLFGVRLPVRDERVRRARNLRAALMQQARERAVLPRELPEWADLVALEREIAG